MTVLDGVALAIVLAFLLLGLKRGLVREAISLAAWVVAFLLTGPLAAWLGPYLPGMTEGGLRDAMAMAVAFIAIFIAAMLISSALHGLVKAAGLSLEDRLLGAVFGFLRGGVVLVVLVLVSGLTVLPQSELWQRSLLSAPLATLALNFTSLLPAELADKIRLT
jgi:membrane protein required for colicin V production